MNKAFIESIEALERERGISKETLFKVIENALVAAYKKEYGANQNVTAYIDRENGDISIYLSLKVVEEVEDENTEMSLAEAQEIDEEYEVGDDVEFMVTPKEFSRIAAQNVKNTIMQKIKETEREMIFNEYIDSVGTLMNGTVQRESRGTLHVNLGKADGILPVKEQTVGERYNVGDRIKVYIMDVKKSTKGAQIFLSRTHPGLVKRLFELEVPEIEDGDVEIVSISREAGSRTKMAVRSIEPGIDPLGACVGARGIRVQNVVDELNNEKIDIILWSDDPEELIRNVLSPAKVDRVEIDEEEKSAKVIVKDDQLSLAIGKSGQNVRLAARVSGWKIDIKSISAMTADDAIEESDAESEEFDNSQEAEVTTEEQKADEVQEDDIASKEIGYEISEDGDSRQEDDEEIEIVEVQHDEKK